MVNAEAVSACFFYPLPLSNSAHRTSSPYPVPPEALSEGYPFSLMSCTCNVSSAKSWRVHSYIVWCVVVEFGTLPIYTVHTSSTRPNRSAGRGRRHV